MTKKNDYFEFAMLTYKFLEYWTDGIDNNHSICEVYFNACKNWGIERELAYFNIERILKMKFEFFCLGAFTAIRLFPDFMPKHFFLVSKNRSRKAAKNYGINLVNILKENADYISKFELRETILSEFNPELKFEQGDILSIDNRILQYYDCLNNERGAVLKFFSQKIVCAVDPEMPLIDFFYASHGMELIRYVSKILKVYRGGGIAAAISLYCKLKKGS